MLCACCITTDGRKVLLHLAVGNKESEECWTEFLRNMIGRGLRIPTSVTADGAPGLINAIDKVLPKSLRIRCWYHKMGNSTVSCCACCVRSSGSTRPPRQRERRLEADGRKSRESGRDFYRRFRDLTSRELATPSGRLNGLSA